MPLLRPCASKGLSLIQSLAVVLRTTPYSTRASSFGLCGFSGVERVDQSIATEVVGGLPGVFLGARTS